jgi:hypothetical protein
MTDREIVRDIRAAVAAVAAGAAESSSSAKAASQSPTEPAAEMVQTTRSLPAVRTQKTVPIVQTAQTVQIICADSRLACEYQAELDRGVEPRPSAVVSSTAEAREIFARAQPLVTLLDESAVPAADALEPAVALLVETAPVVVVAAPERRWELTFFITSGAADFIPRSGSFVSLAAARVERRVRLGTAAADLPSLSLEEFATSFGEVLRHELNNQLTGVLGNAELLLGRRDRLPPDALERLETMRQLSMRLRETVRRLSHAWDLWQRQTQSSGPAAQPPARPLARPALNPTVNNVTTLSTNNAARRSATTLASVPRTPWPPAEKTPRSPETPIDAAGARWDKTWRNRKE